MSKGVTRVCVYVVSLFVIGPIAGALADRWLGPDGGEAATALVSSQPIAGLLVLCAIVGMAMLTGRFVARVSDPAAATGCAGVVLAWAAFRSGPVTDLYAQSETGPMTLAIEGLFAGILCLIAAAAVVASSVKHETDEVPTEAAHVQPGLATSDTARNIGLTLTKGGLLSAGAAAAATLVFASIVAVNDLAGQTFAAAMVGAIAAGALARIVGAGVSEDAPVTSPFLGIAVAAALAPFVASFMADGGLAEAGRTGELLGAAKLGPLDFAAGAMLGAPLGARWFGASSHHPEAASA